MIRRAIDRVDEFMLAHGGKVIVALFLLQALAVALGAKPAPPSYVDGLLQGVALGGAR